MDNIRCTAVNSNGNYTRLTQLVNRINCKECTNDIFIINDCRLHVEDEDKTTLKNHNVIIKNDPQRERYAGGVAMAIPKNILLPPSTLGIKNL